MRKNTIIRITRFLIDNIKALYDLFVKQNLNKWTVVQKAKQIGTDIIKSIPRIVSFKNSMSRKQSYDAGHSSSVRPNFSDKLGDDLYPSKKYQTYLDKFSTSSIVKDNFQQTNFTNSSTQFSTIRKLPDNVSNIRETFSFNTPGSTKSETEPIDNQHRSKNSRLKDLLNQAMQLKGIKAKQYPKTQQNIQSTSVNSNIDNHYPKSQTIISDKFYSTVDDIKQGKFGNNFNFKTSLGTTNVDNRLEKSYSASVQEEIRKLREQNYQKKNSTNRQVDNEQAISPYLKNYSVVSDPKQSFSKKNYFDYYSPKIEKSTTSKLQHDFNTLSPPYQRRKRQASFQVKPQSPKVSPQDSSIKNLLDIPSIKISLLQVPSPRVPLQRKTSSRSNTRRLLNDKVKIQDFEIGKKLGQGRFGTAYLAFHKSTGGVFAIKMVKKEMIKQNKLVEQFILEVKLQSFFEHPFILKIYGIFDDQETIYLVMEYLPQGTLFNYFKNAKNKKLTEEDAAEKVRYLAQSIKYLQDRGIAHRDIKPQNIIMSNNVCKLADFGWATFCDEERRKTYCGTCDYVAPQILQGEEYDQSVDLWCIGVLAYELVAGKAPFYHMSQKQTRNKIMNVNLTYPQDFSENLKSFLGGLIQKNPEERMSIEEVLDHPFIKDVKLVQLN